MTKSVLLEAHAVTLKSGTGIATYARNLTKATSDAGYRNELLIGIDRPINRRNALLAEVALYDAKKPAQFDPMRALSRALDWTIGAPTGARAHLLPPQRIVLDPNSGSPLARPQPTRAALRLEERAFLHFNRYGRRMTIGSDEQYDLFHATRPIPLTVKQAANVYTIHDIVPLRLPYSTLDNKRYFYRILKEIVQKADHIVTVSEFTKRDVMDVFDIDESRITNTWQAVSIDPAFLSMSDDDVADVISYRYGLKFKDYFLFLGAIEPKKNVSRMVEAFAASGTTRPLVLVGGLGWQYERDVETLSDERFLHWRIDGERIRPERSVMRLPFVPLASLMALIRGARAVLFPSLYEGFGLPVLEAMMLGTPTITSNTSSLPEVAGDAALLVDPYKTESIRDAIRTIDSDADLRNELSKRGKERAAFFSPALYSERMAAVYSALLK